MGRKIKGGATPTELEPRQQVGLVDKTNTPPANGMRPQERNLSITDFPPLPTRLAS